MFQCGAGEVNSKSIQQITETYRGGRLSKRYRKMKQNREQTGQRRSFQRGSQERAHWGGSVRLYKDLKERMGKAEDVKGWHILGRGWKKPFTTCWSLPTPGSNRKQNSTDGYSSTCESSSMILLDIHLAFMYALSIQKALGPETMIK